EDGIRDKLVTGVQTCALPICTIQGHKQVREVEVTAAGELTSWDGFTEKAASYGVPDASLWACLIRDVTTQEVAAEPPRALVSTRSEERRVGKECRCRGAAWLG